MLPCVLCRKCAHPTVPCAPHSPFASLPFPPPAPSLPSSPSPARALCKQRYALSWGMPYWVGGGQPLSQGAVQYHIDYLKGALKFHNLTFKYIGIWNEAPWTKEYVLWRGH